jgi:uncharacterized protein (TIGR03083 family)
MVTTSIENLAIVWASIDELCSGLTAGQWDLPTGCPGWSVKDHLSHLADYETRALGRPAPQHEPGPLPHVKNEMGRTNEIGHVDGPAVEESLGYFTRFLPYVAGKRAAALGPGMMA